MIRSAMHLVWVAAALAFAWGLYRVSPFAFGLICTVVGLVGLGIVGTLYVVFGSSLWWSADEDRRWE